MEGISQHVTLIGTWELASYLIIGPDRAVMVDTGPVSMGPVLYDELKQALNGAFPDLVVFTHSHFDHIGGAPYLKRHIPALRFGGHAYLFSVMGREGARKRIEGISRRTTDPAFIRDMLTPADFDYSVIRGDEILTDGDVIDLGGGVTVMAIETPGHTQDSMSYFVQPDEIVLTGEALGIVPGDGLYVGPEFLTSYDDYVDSIKKVASLGPKKILTGHHAFMYSDQVEDLIGASLRDAAELRDKIERYLVEEAMDEERVTARIKEEEYTTVREGKQPEEAYLLNLRARVRAVKNGMEKG